VGRGETGLTPAQLLRVLGGRHRDALVSATSHQHRAQHGADDNATARAPEPSHQRAMDPTHTARLLQRNRHGTSTGSAVARAVHTAARRVLRASGLVDTGVHYWCRGEMAQGMGVSTRFARDSNGIVRRRNALLATGDEVARSLA